MTAFLVRKSYSLNIRKPTIIKWLNQDAPKESRSWQKGQVRQYTDLEIADRIRAIKR
jgi:hypothetical protein